jgi:hypothetical protein
MAALRHELTYAETANRSPRSNILQMFADGRPPKIRVSLIVERMQLPSSAEHVAHILHALPWREGLVPLRCEQPCQTDHGSQHADPAGAERLVARATETGQHVGDVAHGHRFAGDPENSRGSSVEPGCRSESGDVVLRGEIQWTRARPGDNRNLDPRREFIARAVKSSEKSEGMKRATPAATAEANSTDWRSIMTGLSPLRADTTQSALSMAQGAHARRPDRRPRRSHRQTLSGSNRPKPALIGSTGALSLRAR